jgi:Baseplate J-like protein
MSPPDLCQLPTEPIDGCREAQPAPAAAPLPINNPPGLSSIGYRIGTFTSFRRAMLDRVAAIGLLATSPPTPRPFANWHEGADGDYHTIFIELWAYLADILTFYQERIANEAYLGTATQWDSSRRLAQLVDYRPTPGAGASGLLAFTVGAGKVITVASGFRAASRAQPGRTSSIFETSSSLTARAEHNAIRLSAAAPTNQFAQLSSFSRIFCEPTPPTDRIAEELYYSAGSTILKTLPARTATSSGIVRSGVTFRPFVDQTTRTVVLDGVYTHLAAGDYVLTVEKEHATGETGSLHQISTVDADKVSNTTTISWQEPSGTIYQQTSDNPVALYAMRVRASPFGSAAPNWYTLSPTLTASMTSPPQSRSIYAPPYSNWDDQDNADHFMPSAREVDLDGVYEEARATSDNPGWVALVPTDATKTEVHRFKQARQVVQTGYALNARVTQLTLADEEVTPSERIFGIRNTLILTGAEKLPLHNDLPLPDPVQGDTLILDGLYPTLQDGQVAIVSGNLFDQSDEVSTLDPANEVCRLAGPPQQDIANNLTTVKLKDTLANHYIRSTTVLLANVVAATQGETVNNEVLGSSDGGSLQLYPLKKHPLTYVPSIDIESATAVESTLTVAVNGVQWREQPNLFESGPTAQDFTITQDDSGVSTVIFGDGTNGMRPPTGTNNIRARYRVGLGTSGNVPAAGVQQLLDNLAGLQQVTNPQPTIGGADPENLSGIRANAPASMQTFNCAVSTEDYAALARTFPGIAKASARWVLFDTNYVAPAHPYVQLTVAATDGTPISRGGLVRQLRSFLDQRRDPNVPLRILDFTRIYVDIVVTINLDERVPRQETFARVQAALNPGLNPDGTSGYFAFESLDFGGSLRLSAIYAFIQNIPGVSEANVTRLRRMDLDVDNLTMVRDDILIGPTEIAVISNDANQPEHGFLTIVQGTGGFVDR